MMSEDVKELNNVIEERVNELNLFIVVFLHVYWIFYFAHWFYKP